MNEEQLLRFRSKAVQSGAVAGSEECLRRADGENLDCLVSAVSISVADHACLLCTIIDITDRKRSERDLVAAIDKVMADTSWFSSSLIQKLAELRTTSSGDKEENELDSLTRREKEMFALHLPRPHRPADRRGASLSRKIRCATISRRSTGSSRSTIERKPRSGATPTDSCRSRQRRRRGRPNRY